MRRSRSGRCHGRLVSSIAIVASIASIVAVAAGSGYTLALVRDPAPSLTLLRNADQTVSLSWRGAGALEQTASLTPPKWQPATSQANPQKVSTAGAMNFFRMKGD